MSLVSDGDSVKNESNPLVDEWHHKYDVKFTVAASQDPRLYLSRYFDENIEQLGDSAVKISYIETQKIWINFYYFTPFYSVVRQLL